MSNEFPRRSSLESMTPAEIAIFRAMQEVENLPPDTRLTDAVCLLQAAKESVSDYVDGIKNRRFVRTEYGCE